MKKFVSIVWKILLVVLALYILAHGLIRTEWFCGMIERQLGRALGVKMRVGSVRATWGFDFQIHDVIGIEQEAGIAARRVRVRWVFFPPRGQRMLQEIFLDQFSVTFAFDGQGHLQPTRLAEFFGRAFSLGATRAIFPPVVAGEMFSTDPSESELPPPGTPFDDETYTRNWARVQKVPVLIRGGSLRWLDIEENTTLTMSGVDVTYLPMRHHEVAMSYLQCSADEVTLEGRTKVRGLQIKMVDADGSRVLLGLHADDWGGLHNPVLSLEDARELLDSF